MVVLAVPGLPTNTMCRARSWVGRPSSLRRWLVLISATIRRTDSLTDSSPTSASSSASAPSRGTTGFGTADSSASG